LLFDNPAFDKIILLEVLDKISCGFMLLEMEKITMHEVYLQKSFSMAYFLLIQVLAVGRILCKDEIYRE